jgi:transposase-like protein
VAHARAKFTVPGRQLLMERVLNDGWKPTDAAKAMGVSCQTAYKWLRRFRDEGPPGLKDRSSAPRRCTHRLDVGAVATPSWPLVSRPSLGLTGWPMRLGVPVRPSTGSYVESGSSI